MPHPDPKRAAELDALVHAAPVVVFLKGTPRAPRCGFSARVVELLDGVLDGFVAHDVLADDGLRDDLKAHADWPTYPQVWVDGQLIGGADILEQLHRDGGLAEALGVTASTAPVIHASPSALARLKAAAGDSGRLRLSIDGAFRYRFALADAPHPGDVSVALNGLTLVFDATSARRANGLRLDTGPDGARLTLDNPNEPPRPRQLSVHDYAVWRDEGRPHVLIDVRTDAEIARASLTGARTVQRLSDLDDVAQDTPIVVMCHHGVRSQAASEQLVEAGWTRVFNLAGGIDAWSDDVDPNVPRY